MSSRELNPAALPLKPTQQWTDETLIHKWIEAWTAYHRNDRGGFLRASSLHVLHEELMDREIDPAKPLRRHGFNVDSIEVPDDL